MGIGGISIWQLLIIILILSLIVRAIFRLITSERKKQTWADEPSRREKDSCGSKKVPHPETKPPNSRPKIRTHYDNLQVKETASSEVIKGAYKYLSQKWHPDRNPENREKAERISRIVNKAYGVLSDPEQRRQHDEWIAKARLAPVNDGNVSGNNSGDVDWTTSKDRDAKTPSQFSRSQTSSYKDSGFRAHPWRRLWARLMDITLASIPIGIGIEVVNPELFYYESVDAIIYLLALITLIFIEPLFLHAWGTTPGKWFMSTRVVRADGEFLSYAHGLSRAGNVWFRGLGMGIPIVSLATMLVSYRRLTKYGKTSWDYDGGYDVLHNEPRMARILFYIAIMAFFTIYPFLAPYQ